MPERLQELNNWLVNQLDFGEYEIAPASSDASFRRYFRVSRDGKNLITMDAPPDKEDCGPFIRIGHAMREMGLNVPEILAENIEQGFLLLGDLGSLSYLEQLNQDTVEQLYADAIGALVTLQVRGRNYQALFPHYDRALLMAEMALFREWFLSRHLGIDLTVEQNQILDQAFDFLAQSALEQPQVCVHRDYHSRNLMVCEQHNPGVLDFQDAVIGPFTYDLVSLLRDCYIEWPRERVEEWARGFQELAVQSGIIEEKNDAQFLKWFDLMGVQRHLKAIGIFARLNIRDNKPGYLADIPRTLGYVMEVSSRYKELMDLHNLLNDLGIDSNK